MENSEVFDIRVVLKPDDELFLIFKQAKQMLAIKSNTEAARALMKRGFEWLKKADASNL